MKKKLNCVLLIDDDEPTNFLSQLIVESSDCTNGIQVMTSGEEALKYLSSSESPIKENYPRPDLIFLDINMPAMNGWEFLKNYEELETAHRGQIVIIMLTTSLNPDDRMKSESTPYISGFENKPLTEKKLETILKKYFPQNY